MGLFNKKELKRIAELEKIISILETDLKNQKMKNQEYGIYSYEDSLQKISTANDLANKKLSDLNKQISLAEETFNEKSKILLETEEKLSNSQISLEKTEKSLENQKKKLKSARELYKTLLSGYEREDRNINLEEINNFGPTVELDLQCLSYQDLRKEYKENEKIIKQCLETYQERYTTKTNKALYRLMVLALQSELQNILTKMKYDKLDIALKQVDEMCDKYDAITSEGNQNIAGTMRKFIGEINHLFKNAVNIEYEYYVKKEREKAEQAAIREQMRQEAEERKQLEQQKKQVEKEESKYHAEMENVQKQISETSDATLLEKLQQKILDLQNKLNKVAEQKEEIISRQNGKAGNVYVISNLGSFGENVFKIGMTRRLDPMDRVRELGDASVPFSFDVHAMIFSEDAVALESKLHQILNDSRVNKINLRKEFFKVSIDELESIVLKEDPAASFTKTMLAEEYRQTLSIEESNYIR